MLSQIYAQRTFSKKTTKRTNRVPTYQTPRPSSGGLFRKRPSEIQRDCWQQLVPALNCRGCDALVGVHCQQQLLQALVDVFVAGVPAHTQDHSIQRSDVQK